jgi:hypothetical protein
LWVFRHFTAKKLAICFFPVERDAFTGLHNTVPESLRKRRFFEKIGWKNLFFSFSGDGGGRSGFPVEQIVRLIG